MRKFSLILISLSLSMFCLGQDIERFSNFREELLTGFRNERQNIFKRYNTYRDSINEEYSQFLRKAWGDFPMSKPDSRPKEDNFVPPAPYKADPIEEQPIVIVTPKNIPILENKSKPQPIEPIKEAPVSQEKILKISFYGINEDVRVPSVEIRTINVNSNSSIANAWDELVKDKNIDNTLYDLLKIRDKYNLCDWSYLQLLNEFSNQFVQEKNVATLVASFLYFQSGYQMRLAHDNSMLYLLFGSQHYIYNKPYYNVDGIKFYPYSEPRSSLSICQGRFEKEIPLSLLIHSEQKLGDGLTERRLIKSEGYNELSANSQVPVELIEFYNSYPSSAIGSNLLSKWAMYANTPLSEKTKDILYPTLKQSIANCSELEAANKLLNWVQTGFEYEYDDKVWGYDRTFFAEETLYYPYADCEDRSILFSRIIRDLLGLDVALVYYPGHLATAVKFGCEVKGVTMLINRDKYIVCDPTFIGAPVGSQMPGLDLEHTQTLLLER